MWAETLGYRECRIQLTAAFFAALARAAKVSGNDDLLDLGSGPGEVTLGMAPYGGRMTAIDCEQPMLDELARRAEAAGREIRMIHTRVEEAPLDLGRFWLITIGQAHWFMHHPGTFERLDRWLAEGGTVALCVSFNLSSSPWAKAFRTIREKWARGDLRARKLSHAEFFRGTNFVLAQEISIPGEQRLVLDDLLRRAQGFSTSNPEVLGDAAAKAMVEELRGALAPYFRSGPVIEPFINQAFLYRRPSELNSEVRHR